MRIGVGCPSLCKGLMRIESLNLHTIHSCINYDWDRNRLQIVFYVRTKKMVYKASAKKTQAGDIVFGYITGGSSALLPFPVKGVTLAEKKAVIHLLLTSGANIVEINALRKHLSRIKGGRLAKAIHQRAHLINLTVSDVIGDSLDCISDPTVPDTSTFDDARYTLTKYHL